MIRSIAAVLLSAPFFLFAQPTTIILPGNASFEDLPQHSKPPRSWFYCGSRDETPPDIQPNTIFGNTPEAFHGTTYVGLVGRSNGTFEAIGQRLPSYLRAGSCYQWKIMAARSDEYISPDRDHPGEVINHNQALILRVWGGTNVCERRELLAQSGPVHTTEWQPLVFQLNPSQDQAFIILEAFYDESAGDPYSGNLLLDHAGPFLELDCPTGEIREGIMQLSPPVTGDPSTLEALVREQGPQIRFGDNHLQLERSYFETSDHQFFISNPALWQVMTGLTQLPDTRLKVGIVTRSRKHYVDRRNTLRLTIREMGLSDHQLIFVQVRPGRQTRKPWWYTHEDADLLFRED